MKNRFKTMSGALALTLMLIFSAVAFAHTGKASMGSPNLSSAPKQLARNVRRDIRRHRRHHRHHRRNAIRKENQEMRRDMKRKG